jgi:hypothetical protein
VDEVLVASDAGSTVGAGNDMFPNCGASNASDVAFYFTATSSRTYTFNTIGSNYDTVIALFADCGAVNLTCNDDFYGLQSRVQWFLNAGESVIVVVDGFSTSQGNYVVTVF